jgi:vancomycin permeability regulator SanA
MASRPQTPWLKRARRTRRLRVVWRAVGIAVLALVVYVIVTFVQVIQTSNRDEAGEGPAEAIIVLGAAQYNGQPSGVLQGRLDHAAGLFADGVAPVVVVTGGSQPGDDFTEAGAALRYLIGNGIPQDAIRPEVTGANTWESLAAAARFLKEEDITDVVLVSSPYHALRTRLIAEEVGLDARTSPAEESTEDVGGTIVHYARETVAVAAGRVVGFRRLVGLDEAVTSVRNESNTG